MSSDSTSVFAQEILAIFQKNRKIGEYLIPYEKSEYPVFTPGEWEGDFYEEFQSILPGDITITVVDQQGSLEEGASVWMILKVTDMSDNQVYLKLDAKWFSYSGAQYEDVKIVTPVEKTVTVYE